MTGALDGYRLIDLTTAMGALCPRLFAGLGCDVVRVVAPGAAAGVGATSSVPDPWAIQQQMGFRQVVIDPGTASGRQAFADLVSTADFVIESWQPGSQASARFDGDALRSSNPDLIWVSITPFGLTGPRAHWRGTDLIGMAAGGLLYLCGDRDRPPVRVSAEQAYAQAGVQAAAGAMAALTVRNRFGVGQLVDVSMQAAITNTLGNARLYYAMDGVINERAGGGRSFGAVGSRLIYASSDGFIAFSRLPESYAILHGWMLESGFAPHFDPARWSTMPGAGRGTPPVEMTAAFDADLEPFFASKQTDELYLDGQARGLMICPVSSVADLCRNAQLIDREWFVELRPPGLDRVIQVPGAPFRMSETPWTFAPPPHHASPGTPA